MKIELTCSECGAVFTRNASVVAHGRGKTCSRACQYKSVARKNSGPRAQRTCIGCGAVFEILASLLDETRGVGKYCNRACRDLHRCGPLHPQWVGASADSAEYRGPNWQSQRRKVLARDERTCQDCGVRDEVMHVHHIIPFRLWENYRYANVMSNLVTLCAPCHRSTDAMYVWANVDGGVVRMLAGGPAHSLVKDRGMMSGNRDIWFRREESQERPSPQFVLFSKVGS